MVRVQSFCETAVREPVTRLCMVLVCAFLAAWSPPVQAQKVALIIANSAYVEGGSLRNPPLDAKLVSDAAQSAGFEVTIKHDLGLNDFTTALYEFQSKANNADVAMIYFAGHGMETSRGKYVIPSDAVLPGDFFLQQRAINVNLLVETLSKADNAILVLDACRENSFGSSWETDFRSLQVGFKTDIQAEDMLILFSAGPNQRALDGPRGESSPFAKAFARWIPEPGLLLTQLPTKVSSEVQESTNGQQRPFASVGLDEEIYLVARPLADDPFREEMAWANALQSDTVDGYEEYLRDFPGSAREVIALGKLAQLQRAGGQSASPPAPRPQPVVARAEPAPAAPLARPQASQPARPAPTPPAPAPMAPAPAPRAAELVQPRPSQQVATAPEPAPAGALPASPAPASAPAPTPVAVVVAPSAYVAPRPQLPEPVAMAAPAPVVGASSDDPQSASALMRTHIPGTEAVSDQQPLPALPTAPQFSAAAYPACKENFRSAGDYIAKIRVIDQCTVAINGFYTSTMHGFVDKMIAHQKELDRLYNQDVANNTEIYSSASRQKFFQDMRKEHAASNPDGPYFADYRAMDSQREQDLDFLRQNRAALVGN